MIKIEYSIEPGQKKEELAWLKSIYVFPATENSYDWLKQKSYIRLGMIVAPDTALLIKLRHPLKFQENYKQR
jgi:hypothetical protein